MAFFSEVGTTSATNMKAGKNYELSRSSHVNHSKSVENTAQQADDIQEYEYNYLMEQNGLEEIRRYNRGGFHPIHLGDVLNDRFEVIHKLGSGGFGTVWLCQDCHTKEWRAIKIMVADHSSDSAEAKTFEFLKQNSSPEELDQNHIAVPLETFWIEGPNGRHFCLVMQIYGGPVSNWRLDLDAIDPSTKKTSTELCGQITQALAFLHEKGICHGDFRPSNILMKLDQDALKKLDKVQMENLLGEAEAWELHTTSGESPRPKGPDYCVIPVAQKWCEKLLIPEIAVVDFGESFFTQSPRKTTGIPRSYAGPEVLFNRANAVRVDSWSLACTIYEVRTGDQLFGGAFSLGNKFDTIVREIIAILGPLPEAYDEIWHREFLKCPRTKVSHNEAESSDTIATDLDLEESDRIQDSGYDNKLEAMLGAEKVQYPPFFGENSSDPPTKYRYEREEVLVLADLLRSLLKYDAEKRLEAKSVLQHPWLQHTAASRKSRSNNSGPRGCYMTRFWSMFWDLGWGFPRNADK
ncbi:kinase-like domain-containing protein [Xylaria sp. FL0933]|nr:kinase-like domain-containing protein [Xylaria sp. FL0933]